MRSDLTVVVSERTENSAKMTVSAAEDSDIAEIWGIVRGPFSKFSRTLTADFAMKPSDGPKTVSAMVMEPCYWTPQLPFWYDLRLTLKLRSGEAQKHVYSMGFKRFYSQGRSFFLEGKRIVLRGISLDSIAEADLKIARENETALVSTDSDFEMLAHASAEGVPIILDWRKRPSDGTRALQEYNWYPSAMICLVNDEQQAAETWQPRECLIAVSVVAHNVEPSVKCDAYMVELKAGEQPPAWAVTCNRPVIVIHKNPGATIETARAGCDKLQADLAPEFDLAGYFV